MGDDDDLKRGRSTAALMQSFDVAEDLLVVNSNLEQPSRKRLIRDHRQAAAREKQQGEK